MSHMDTNNKRTKRKHNAERRVQSKKLQNHYNMYGGDISDLQIGKLNDAELGFINTTNGAKAEYQDYMKSKSKYDLILQTLEDLTLDADKAARVDIITPRRLTPIDTTSSLLKRVGKKITSQDKFTYYIERVSSSAADLEDELTDSLIKIANYKLFSKGNKINTYKYALKISDLEARIDPLRLIVQQLKEITEFIVKTSQEDDLAAGSASSIQTDTRVVKIQKRLRWLKVGNIYYGLKDDTALAAAAIETGGAAAGNVNFKTNLDNLKTEVNTKLEIFGKKLDDFIDLKRLLDDAKKYLSDNNFTDSKMNIKITKQAKIDALKKYYDMIYTIIELGYYDKVVKGFNWGDYINNMNPAFTMTTILRKIKQIMPTSLASNVDIKAKNFEKLYSALNLIYYGVDNNLKPDINNYGATFDANLPVDVSAAVGGSTIVEVISLTDKLYVLRLAVRTIYILKLNENGEIDNTGSGFFNVNAAAFPFPERCIISRLSESRIVCYRRSQ